MEAIYTADPGSTPGSIPGKPAHLGFPMRVTDHGIEIKAVHLERVQGMLQRLCERERFPGLGVGLAIAKKIAVRNGGRLQIKTTPGN